MTRLSDRAIALCLAVGIVVLLLVMGAWNDVPMNDDFSYARTTEALAREGHIVFNGWGTPLMLPQMALGALLIKAFGFSFALLHTIGFVAAGVCAALIFLLGRACGLRRLTALTIGKILILSPFFLGAAPTYLTDLPGLALTLGTLLLLVRSVTHPGGFSPRIFVAAGAVGVLAGLERQSQWLPFLGALALIALLVPVSRRLAAGFAAGALALAVSLTRWFDSYPYTVPVRFDVGLALMVAFPQTSFRVIYKLLNAIGLFVFPFALGALSGRKVRWLLMGALVAFCLLPPFHPMGTQHMDLLGDRYMFTFYGQYFTSHGVVVGAVDGFTARPAVLPPAAIAALVLVGAVGLALGGYLYLDWWEQLSAQRKEKRVEPLTIARSALAVYATVQIVAFFPWLAQMNIFDRYLLPILPCVLIVHAAQMEASTAPRWLRSLPLVFAALYGLYGIGSAVEYFGLTRARQTLYRRLLERGVPDAQIDGGFEFNADTQVRRRGHMNNLSIARPPDAFDKNATGAYVAYIPEHLTALDARWRLSTTPKPDEVEPAPVDSVTYFSPLPPFSRTVGVYKIVRPD